ncbi:MAG TPA: hypothetical protein VK327_15335, partial [Candidatus Paceibacterota bacterium]|nr:hypothetical protein [Candidatus Paceibacterota bacterium]
MQVTSLLSREEHSHGHHHHEHGPGCSCGHEHVPVRLKQTLVGVVFVLNAFIVDWVLKEPSQLASASAMIGALILGTPIILIAIKDLREGRLSINELVAIAVLAAFASGAAGGLDHVGGALSEAAGAGYKTAG